MTETYKAQRSSGLNRSGRPAATHLMLVCRRRATDNDGTMK